MRQERIKVQFLLDDNNDEFPRLFLKENCFVFKKANTQEKIIPFDSINGVKISVVNRIYNPSVGFLKDGVRGFMSHINAGKFSIYLNYYIDLDIYTNQVNYLFESYDLEEAAEFVLKLENNFTIVDDLHLLDLFKTKSFNEAREYIDNNYRYWAKQYNLENPRTTLDTSMTEMVQRKIKK